MLGSYEPSIVLKEKVIMTKYDVELVGKIGSMALINREYGDIDYNTIARISRELRPGMIWVTSGATEIGRLDYIRRNGVELEGDETLIKTDYSAQGQAILMQNYRTFIDERYSVRQILVEHQHFNDEVKADNLRNLLLRCPAQNAIPIINYNDAVCAEENRRFEITSLQKKLDKVIQGVDNDETASHIACLVKAKRLIILTSVNGIYRNPEDPSTLVDTITGSTVEEVLGAIDEYKACCKGTSRKGSGGAEKKLEYVKEPIEYGAEVYIANAKYSLSDIIEGRVPRTIIKRS